MRWRGDLVMKCLMFGSLLLLPIFAQGEDCNDDGKPDDEFGLGLLFFDTFPFPVLDADKWALIDGATIDAVGLAEPTPPYALRLNGNTYGGDQVQTITIDLSEATSVVLRYAFERTGGGEKPDNGDDLFVEFRDAAGNWVELARHLGSGASMQTFTQHSLILPATALHVNFALRFRNRATIGMYDDWFVDDVFLVDGVPDCNGNGIPDDCDIAEGTSSDCNANGFPDECDLSDGVSADCNENGIPDECDVASGYSADVNEDVIPDECQDCNGNQVLDPIDIEQGTSADCNFNGIPDECDLASGLDSDCDGNGVPDACDIAPRHYQIDDGTFEVKLGSSYNLGLIWMNQFVIEPGGEDLVGVELAWGTADVGHPTTLAIWIDPNHDGDPADAVLLLTVDSVPVANPSTNRFTHVSIPRTRVGAVGDVFFVGAYMADVAVQYPGALDISSLPAHQSWLAFGSNLENLSDNPYPPATIDTYGYPGNFLIRAVSADRDCNENGTFDLCDIAAADSYDNNENGVLDECEWGDALAMEMIPSATCYSAGDEVRVEIWMLNAQDPIVGGQFFVDYDPDRLSLIEVAPAGDPSPFTDQIYECSIDEGELYPQCVPVSGRLDYAVGVGASEPGCLGSQLMAIMRFTALQPLCAQAGLIRWRTDSLVRLGTADNQALYPLLVNTSLGDAQPPELNIPASLRLEINQPGVCLMSSPLAAEATDNCTEPTDLQFEWERSDGNVLLTDPFNVVDSPITIHWSAEDECGYRAEGATVVTVLLLGDLDDDLDVDISDLAQMLSNYGIAGGATYEQGDLDHDGDVDISDLAALLSMYSSTCP